MKHALYCATQRRAVMALALAIVPFFPYDSYAEPQVIRSIQISDGSYLGIEMEEVTPEKMSEYKLTAERGVIVRSVEKGSPAELAALQEKDVILEYGGTPVLSSMQMARLVRETPEGRKVDLLVSRDGKRVNLSVKVGRRDGPLSSGDRRIEIRPHEFGREFEFGGPSGRMFRFEIPERDRSFGFAFPDRGGTFFSAGTPRLGLMLQTLTDQMGDFLGVPGKKGALVTSVAEGSAAASARIRAGDVIVRAADRPIDDPEDLTRAIRQRDAGDRIELRLIRDKKEITVTLEMPKGERKTGTYRM